MNTITKTREYSQAEIRNILLSHKVISKTILALKELNIQGYIYGKYVRNLLLGKSTNEINLLILGDVIEVAKSIKSLLGKQCIITQIKNAGNVNMSYSSIAKQQVFLFLTDTINDGSTSKHKITNLTVESFLSYNILTVDSLAIRLDQRKLGTIINPYNGLNDLRNGCITTITDPSKAFRNNPEMILKCFTLLTYPKFYLSNKCQKALKENRLPYKIDKDKKENIEGMMLEIISSSNLSFILLEMHKMGFLSKLIPEVSALDTTEYKNGFTYRNDFIYTLNILDEVCQRTENVALRLVTLFLYIGKMQAKRFDSIKGWTFHGMHFISIKMIPPILRRLGLYHELMRISYYENMIIMLKNLLSLDVVHDSDSAIRRIITNAGKYLDDLLLLYNCCKKVQNKLKSTSPCTEDLLLKERIQRVQQRDNAIQCKDILSINGHMILDLYPKCTGRQIGQLKHKMAQNVLNGTVSNDYNSLLPLLLSYAKELGLKEKCELGIESPNLIQELKVQKFSNCRIIQANTSLTIYENGTFVIKDYNDKNDTTHSMVIKDESQNMILQCYETGYVNKVNINEIFKLRREFVYNNAIYRKALIQNILVSSDKEFLMVKLQNKNKNMIQIVPVSSIKEHSMLGLKGTNIIQESNLLNWNIVRNCDETKIFQVFNTNSFPISININDGVTNEIANWIKEYVS